MTPECPQKYAWVEHEPHDYIFGGVTHHCNGYKKKRNTYDPVDFGDITTSGN
jgi:hypothetical protein